MPIRPENRALYPKNWKSQVVPSIRDRSGGVCEGSPAFPDCRAVNGEQHPISGAKVVLTVAHLNHDPRDCSPENLRHWCQKCHNTYDAHHRAAGIKQRRARMAEDRP